MSIWSETILKNIDIDKITGSGNESIKYFGISLNKLPSDLWDNFLNNLQTNLSDDLKVMVKELMIRQAQENGYHIAYEITNSLEWKTFVEPEIQKTEEVFVGIFEVLGTLKWAKTEIIHIIPEKELKVRATDYYEQDEKYKGRMKSYFLAGIYAGCMDLIYGGEYPKGLYKYGCKERKIVENGQKYSEFLVKII